MVRELSGKINRKAWTGTGVEAGYRDAIINRSLHHPFTAADFTAIAAALEVLTGRSNRAAWQFVRATVPDDVLHRRLTEPNPADNFDAINDVMPPLRGLLSLRRVQHWNRYAGSSDHER